MPTPTVATPPTQVQTVSPHELATGGVNARFMPQAPTAYSDPNSGITHLTPPTAGTMTANISSPNNTTKAPAPAVITSSAASTDLANKQNQIAQLNTDTANHAAVVNTPLPQAPTATDVSATQPAGASSTSGSSGTPSYIDDQVNDILSGFNTQEENINDTANTQESTLSAEATQAQTDLDTQATAALSKLASISAGTYPLSPAEQQVMSATQAGFQSAIQLQTTANAGYTGQMTEAMASLGINTSAPTQALGMIYAAVNTGTSKIADLNSQMAISLGNLQLGFQKQDFDMVQQSWDETASYMENRIKTLTDMQTQIQTAATAQVDEIQKATQMNLTTLFQSAQFTYTQKEDVIKNALAQGTLDEKQAADLRTYDLGVANLNLKEQAQAFTESQVNGPSTGAGTSSVTTDTQGNPNTAQQAAFLATLPPNIAAQVKAIANYKINPVTYPQRLTSGGTGLTRQQAITLAEQYDPNYDENQFTARAATMKSFESGTYSQNVTALNTAISHLNTLASLKTELGNVGFTPANVIKNATESALGVGTITANQLTMNAAVGEIAGAFKKSGATDTEIANLGTIDTNSSPEQIQSYIASASNLLSSRLDALNGTYSSSMGTEPPGGSFLSVQNQQSLLNLQKQGYKIDVPSLASSPVVKLQSFYSSSKANASLIDQLIQADPSLANDPQQTEDLLAAQGIQI